MAIIDAKAYFAREVELGGASVGTVIKGSTTWSGSIGKNKSQIVDQDKGGDAVGQELTVKAVLGGTAAVSGTTASTLQVKLQTSDTTTDGDFEDLVLSPAIKVNGMVPGTPIFQCRIPTGTKRYLRATVIVGGATTSNAVISVFATRDL